MVSVCVISHEIYVNGNTKDNRSDSDSIEDIEVKKLEYDCDSEVHDSDLVELSQCSFTVGGYSLEFFIFD
jgi:hypothetical protein